MYKRILSWLLAIALVFALSVSAFAGSESESVTDESSGDAAPALSERQAAEAPAQTDGLVYGFVAYASKDGYQYRWICFPSDDPSEVTVLSEAVTPTFAAAYAWGTVYGFTREDNQGVTGTFYTIDVLQTPWTPVYSEHVINGTVIAMALDYTTGTMYAILDVNNGRTLNSVNLESGELTLIGALATMEESVTVMTLSISETGKAYGIGFDGNLYSVDLSTGACALIGATGKKLNFVQSAAWDFRENRLLWVHVYSAEDNGLYEVNTSTGAAAALEKQMGMDAEILCLFTVPENERYRIGDVNGDGRISVADAAMVLRASVELVTLTPLQSKAALCDEIDGVGVTDAVAILRYTVGLIDSLPAK